MKKKRTFKTDPHTIILDICLISFNLIVMLIALYIRLWFVAGIAAVALLIPAPVYYRDFKYMKLPDKKKGRSNNGR